MNKVKKHNFKKPDYYFYIDDSGTRNPAKINFINRSDGMDHFALGGVLVLEKDKKYIKDKYIVFCNNWKINYPLHSTEIRGMRNNFSWLKEDVKNREKFLNQLEEFLVSLPVIGFAAVVYRPGYNERYKKRYQDKQWLMCKTSYSILIERVSKYLRKTSSTLYLRFEGAGKKEDNLLIKYTRELKNIGHPFNSETSKKYKTLDSSDYKKIILGEPRRKNKENLFTQIADLYLYPMVKRVYDPEYPPWKIIYINKKVIDSYLDEDDLDTCGIKYSCFEYFLKNKRPK